jgi:hypothetical protein
MNCKYQQQILKEAKGLNQRKQFLYFQTNHLALQKLQALQQLVQMKQQFRLIMQFEELMSYEFFLFLRNEIFLEA